MVLHFFFLYYQYAMYDSEIVTVSFSFSFQWNSRKFIKLKLGITYLASLSARLFTFLLLRRNSISLISFTRYLISIIKSLICFGAWLHPDEIYCHMRVVFHNDLGHPQLNSDFNSFLLKTSSTQVPDNRQLYRNVLW